MSKDFFRVKKGLNIKPTDPTTVTDLEDGDIIVDSTDNQLKKYSEEDGEFSTIAGSGGTVANFFSDFDKLTPTVSNATVADDSVTFLPIDDNNKSKKATFSAAGSVLYEVASEADLEGNQGLMTVWIKTSLNSVTVSTTTDGAVQSTLSVLGTNKWKQYEIPFVVGGTDQGFIVEAGEAGDVFIDEPFVGLAPAGYTSKIATTITDWVSYAPQWLAVGTNPSIGDGTIEGNWKRVGDTLDVSITLKIGSTTTFGSNNWYFTLPNNLQIDVLKLPSGLYGSSNVYVVEGSGFAIDSNSVTNRNVFVPYYNDVEKAVLFQPAGSSSLSGAFPFTPESGDSYAFNFSVPIAGWSTDYSTVVTQNTELTAQTANEFTFKVNADGTVSNENFDIVDGNCSVPSTGSYLCNFKSGIFNTAPICNVQYTRNVDTSISYGERIAWVNDANTDRLNYQTSFNGSLIDQPVDVICTKSSTDYNKSATIIGKFENINSSELVKVRANNSVSQTDIVSSSNTTVQYDTKITDNYNAFNLSTETFTSPKDTQYLICAGLIGEAANYGTSSYWQLQLNYSGSGSDKYIDRVNSESTSTQNPFAQGCVKLDMLEGETLSLIVRQTSGSNKNTLANADFNYLSISELPDTSSIVKNLLAESSQTKCQTKFLSADVNANGTSDSTDPNYIPALANIEFNNLTVGKRYSLNSFAALSVDTDTGIGLDIIHDGEIITRNVCGNSAGISNCVGSSIVTFVATDSSLKASTASFSNTNQILYGDGTRFRTNVTLCQLPDTYVDTDEW